MPVNYFVHFFLFTTLLVSLSIQANPIDVYAQRGQVTDFDMAYFIDRSESMGIDDIIKQTFTPSTNKLSLSTGAKMTWAKIPIENNQPFAQRVYLHHPYAYHNRAVGLYEVEGDKVHQVREFNADDIATHEWMFRGTTVFGVDLAPYQSKVLYVKSAVYSHQWFTLELHDEEHSKRALLGTYTDIALMVGTLLALIIYNFILYISSRRKESLFYAFYLISGAIWISLSYGLWADLFDVYGANTLRWHITLMTMPIFLVLFMMEIFETKAQHKKEHWALRGILALLLVEFVYGCFDILGALKYSNGLAAIMMLVTLLVTLSLVIKKHPLAPYFLLGHGCFVGFSGIAVMFYFGKVPFTFVNSHGVGIGIMLEALVLALIIAYRIKILEDLKAEQEVLKLQAATDPLTQLYNRRHFFKEAEEQLALAQKQQYPIALAIFDIDHFKQVNDNHGHGAGDVVIQQVANLLHAETRSGGTTARIGGEEFVLLLPNMNQDEGLTVANRVRSLLASTPIPIHSDRTLSVTLSGGVVEIAPNDMDINEAIERADTALYNAKKAGRNRCLSVQDEPCAAQ